MDFEALFAGYLLIVHFAKDFSQLILYTVCMCCIIHDSSKDSSCLEWAKKWWLTPLLPQPVKLWVEKTTSKLANSIFSGPSITNLRLIQYVLTEIVSHANPKKKKGLTLQQGFKISQFYSSFTIDVMAVKGWRRKRRRILCAYMYMYLPHGWYTVVITAQPHYSEHFAGCKCRCSPVDVKWNLLLQQWGL